MNRILSFSAFRALLFAMCFVASGNLWGKRDLTYFWGEQNGLLKAQTELTLELVDSLLMSSPADCMPTRERKAALFLLDQIMHDTRLDGSEIVSSYFNRRMDRVLSDFKMPVADKIRVYKLYNDGWIIRSPSVTVAWDIYRGPETESGTHRLMSDSVAMALADKCDILFLTHNHPDHVDPYVVSLFTKAGKPVVAPNEILPQDSLVMHYRKEAISVTEFLLQNGMALPTYVIPGHQDRLENNLYIVTLPEGYTVCSTGDQWRKEDLELMLNLPDSVPDVDVFMPICWAAKLEEMCKSFKSKLVLTGHENELGHHSIDHREAYWLSLHKVEDFAFPTAVLTWGEWMDYRR